MILLHATFERRLTLVETGRFWCLFCDAERSYQLREWSQSQLNVFVIIPWFQKERGRFVRCDECRETFDLECLDETSTKTRNELTVSVPLFAWEPARLPAGEGGPSAGRRPDLAEYLGWDELSAEVTSE